MDLAKQLMADIAKFKKTSGAYRLVMVWCGSTEKYQTVAAVHQASPRSKKASRKILPIFPRVRSTRTPR